MDLIAKLKEEVGSYADLNIDLEEKAFYDILNSLMQRLPLSRDEKLKDLAKAVKAVVDDKAKYMDWSKRDDIKYELKADLIVLLDDYGYPPIDRDEVYKEIFEQAENIKKYATVSDTINP